MRKIEIQPYQKQWPILFESERQKINAILGKEVVAIHHIGSTAVTGLNAKPIIDILPVVHDINNIDTFNEAMADIGYKALGENGIEGRRFFKKGESPRTHHVHVFQETNRYDINRHLAVRDYLRTHGTVARNYSALKIQLARQFTYDNEGYCDGKDAFVKQLEKDALAWYLK
ncbi:GrpB family protein [Staphylococcus edaphicus]|uniref:GrpB family protein n=1 Tax=Staphylococcus edaphicus TaxID=1955013 RepID=A0A2C6WIV5_9STAP|nr:GrpB family protein [Staphylococcus edaphicus]PHK49030.1 hypothetical protein BTJ66_10420 [Staphylococcus edaphicus]UQW81354.1 GrpB family protein [Staphylococcus edaphicus]